MDKENESGVNSGTQGLVSGFSSGMNKPADTIRRGNFSRTPHGMDHYLARAIGAGHVIRFTLD